MMKYVNPIPWIVVIFCCCLRLTVCSTIALEGRGYKGIVVAISNLIHEDDELVPNLKALFTNASQFLYSATNNGVYFKEVTIVVPRDWSHKPEYIAGSGSFFDSADVRVDAANDEYGDAPYTLQPGGCGEPGQYIHLTPRFVKEVDKTTEIFGKPERQLVHEWAHLRYGVFDEYGIPGHQHYPTFYIDGKEIRPTGCTDGIPGWIESRKGGPCSIMPDGQVGEDCVFVPDMEDNSVKASIMYMPFLPSMEGFCDKSTPHREHNEKAPTRHNVECNYESTWTVISRHKDFQSIRQSTVGQPNRPQSLIPTFRIIQPKRNDEGHYVLVLDVSGSMQGVKMKLLHQAASRVVEDRIKNTAKLGIVKFSTRAKILHELTTVLPETRQELSRSLPTAEDPGGSTAIGSGLKEAMKVLRKGNSSPAGGVIILVTDGEENVRPYIAHVIDEIVKEKVIVNSVAFGSSASQKIESLSKKTGGKTFFYSDVDGKRPPSALDSAFLESTTSQSDVQVKPYRVRDETFDLQLQTTKKVITIDNELGRNTVFTVTSQYIERVEMSLLSPTMKTYDFKSREYNRDNHRRERIQINLPDARGGKWRVILTRRGSTSFAVALSVTSEQSGARKEPIIVKSWLSDTEVNFPGRLKVFSRVRKGSKVVLGATVMATVDGPLPHHNDRITLKDDGADADGTKDDGIYSGYFNKFSSNGRYSVFAEVVNNGKARLKSGTLLSKSREIPRVKDHFTTKPKTSFPLTEFEIIENTVIVDKQDFGVPAPNFERSSDCGSFLLHGWRANAGDVIPPGDIRDLVLLHSSEDYDKKTSQVALQWTSVGDDSDSGTATSFELWASEDMDGLIKNVRSGFRIPEKNVINGTLQPMSPGTLQTATVLVPFPNVNETLYFAMKAKDEAGNVSPKHDVVTVNLGIKKMMRKTTTSCSNVNNHYHYHYHYHYDKCPVSMQPAI